MHVTADACEALSNLLARRSNPNRCLRLSTVHGAYRFVIDEPIELDVTYSHEERLVLCVSETVSRDLWGITVDTTLEDGKQKLIFRKAAPGEPFDAAKEAPDGAPAIWRASEHERLLGEIADINRQISTRRGGSKSALREQLQTLEASKQAKWDAIRALWAGDGGWHKRNGDTVGAAVQ